MSDTFTQEQVDKAVADAVAAALADATKPLQEKLDELQGQLQETEVGKAVSEAIEAKQAEIDDLAAKLADAEAEKSAATKAHEDLKAFWDTEITNHQIGEWLDAVQAERTEQVRELDVFAEEWFAEEANTAAFATMSSEAFEAMLESYSAIKAKFATPGTTTIPAKTAITAARSGSPARQSTSSLGALREIRGAKTNVAV